MKRSYILKYLMVLDCLLLMAQSISGLHNSAVNFTSSQEIHNFDYEYSYEYIEIDESEVKYIDLTEDEINMLAKLIYLEAGTESNECKKAVGSAVLNRVTTSGKSLRSIIYEPNQFTPAHKIETTDVCSEYVDIVKELIKYGPTIPEYVTFFRSDHYFEWGNRYSMYKQIDNTYFSYDNNLYEKLNLQGV